MKHTPNLPVLGGDPEEQATPNDKSAYPLPPFATVVIVTREMAGDWLDHRCGPNNKHQRKLSQFKVAQYAETMRQGGWRLTPQGLMFDMDGWCINGQHRLQALRDSGLEQQEFWVFPNESSTLFAFVDTGYGRTAAQLWEGSYATAVTSAVRYLVPGKLGVYQNRMSPDAVLELVSKWGELSTHASVATNMGIKNRIPVSAHLAVLAQAERTEHRDMINEWTTGITYGADLSLGDPRLQVRDRFAALFGTRKPPALNYNLLVKGWNNFVEGRRVQTLRWAEPEGTLTVTGYDPNAWEVSP